MLWIVFGVAVVIAVGCGATILWFQYRADFGAARLVAGFGLAISAPIALVALVCIFLAPKGTALRGPKDQVEFAALADARLAEEAARVAEIKRHPLQPVPDPGRVVASTATAAEPWVYEITHISEVHSVQGAWHDTTTILDVPLMALEEIASGTGQHSPRGYYEYHDEFTVTFAHNGHLIQNSFREGRDKDYRARKAFFAQLVQGDWIACRGSVSVDATGQWYLKMDDVQALPKPK